MIDKGDQLPVTRQCKLLGLSRSGIYYKPVRPSEQAMELMRRIDEIHLAYPFYGSRKIRDELWAKGYDVGRDRVRRLMRRMGMEALYVKPRLSWAHPAHEKYQSWSGKTGQQLCFLSRTFSIMAGTPIGAIFNHGIEDYQ